MDSPGDNKKPPAPLPPVGPIVRKVRFDAAHAGVRGPHHLATGRDRPDNRS